LNDIKKITFFIDESKRQNIPVLGPDVNESYLNFMVNDKGEIRFGLAGIKNVGENAALSIIDERDKKGHYLSIFDFTKRVNLKSVNKRSMESLAMAGAFDSFEETHRAQYFYRENSDDTIFLEKIVKHAGDFQTHENAAQVSLFGDMGAIEVKDPKMPVCAPWTKLEQLKNEKDVTGFYMSGHPLEDFKIEIDYFCNVTINDVKSKREQFKNKSVSFAGIVTEVNHRTSKTGNPFATFSIEDFSDFDQFILFSEDYLKMKHFLLEGSSLFVRAQIQPRNNKNRDQLEVRISSIVLLSEVIEKFANEIRLQIPLSFISSEFVRELSDLVKRNAGNCRLKFEIVDEENNTSIGMPVPKHTVSGSAFAKEIGRYPELKFKFS
jgi:DNA polymerase-3 subunit alpha